MRLLRTTGYESASASSGRLPTILFFLLLLFPGIAFAQSGDLELKAENLTLSDATVTHLQTVKIYATVNNNSGTDLRGVVQFSIKESGQSIENDQPISVVAKGTDTVFVSWTPSAGTYTLHAKIVPWDNSEDDAANNQQSRQVTVDYDIDHDGVGNAQDPDDDNDKVLDKQDAFPADPTESVDTNGDGIGDNADQDDDSDNVPDTIDAFPQDPLESQDTDQDTIGDNTDPDDDNDGIEDTVETSPINPITQQPKPVTDPLKSDTDGDGKNDKEDAFPTNPKESVDTDGDKIGNVADPDDENDGLPDTKDKFPLNKGPVIVVEQTEIIETLKPGDPGVRLIVYDASKSYDPEGKNVVFRWFAQDGRLIGEEAVLKLRIGANTLFPVSLTLIDEMGEFRTQGLKIGEGKLLGTFGLSLGIALILTLAFLIYMRYVSGRVNKKSHEKRHPPKKLPSRRVSRHE